MCRMSRFISTVGLLMTAALFMISCLRTETELERIEVYEMEAALDDYVSEAEQQRIPLDAVVVLQHGQVVGERYMNGWQKDSAHHMWSTSKSYTSLAIGFAVNEGLVGLDDKVCTYFPEYYDPHMDGSEQGDFIADGTIRDYLVMATGQEHDPTEAVMFPMAQRHPEIPFDDNLKHIDDIYETEGRNMIEDLFAVPFTKRPGSCNCYNSVATYVLSAIIQKVTGEKTVDYLDKRLWKPLGIAKPEWNEVNGVSAGGWGLMLTAEDMAKTGQMLLDGGKYAGRQVVPAGYLKEAVTAYFAWGPPGYADRNEAPSYHQGYGYQFWINGDGFNTAGAQGQFIVVLPKYDAVIVGIADIRGDDHKEMGLMWKHIVPVLKQRVVTQVRMSDFGLTPDNPENAREKIHRAIEYCKSLGTPAALSFEKGLYRIEGEGHLLDIREMDNFTVDGGGSRLIFHDLAGLAEINDSRHVSIRGFEVDWDRPFISQVTVEGIGPDWFTLKMDPQRYPYVIEDGRVKYICADRTYGLAKDSYNNVFTPDGSRIKPGSFDNYALGSTLEGQVENLGNDVIRFAGPLPAGIEAGDLMTLYHVRYNTPLVRARNSMELTFEDMDIHHCTGLGFYLAGIRNVRIDKVHFTPSDNRVFTAVADAFHLVHCSGNVRITGCHVDGQGDDAINVHGRYFHPVRQFCGGKKLEIGTRRGEIILNEGDLIAYVDTLTGARKAVAEIKSVRFPEDGSKTVTVKVEKLHGEDISDVCACAIENVSLTPTVFIASNTFGASNRARGILITTPRHCDVFWNTFRSAGAAILVEGDLSYWYESGAVRDLNIRYNTFEYCHQSEWGRATICFSPSFHTDQYHDGVTISDNRFLLAPGDSALYHHGVRNIRCDF